MQQPTDPTAHNVSPPAVSPSTDALTAADGQPAEGEREQEALQSADGMEQKAMVSPVSAPSPNESSQTARRQDSYDYDRTSIILVAHLRPANQDGQPRQVWLSAQNGIGNEQDFPLYRLLSEADLGGPWPRNCLRICGKTCPPAGSATKQGRLRSPLPPHHQVRRTIRPRQQRLRQSTEKLQGSKRERVLLLRPSLPRPLPFRSRNWAWPGCSRGSSERADIFHDFRTTTSVKKGRQGAWQNSSLKARPTRFPTNW